ncbi:MAG: hypothetical protein IKA65_07315 [Lentisphaeria bacterium]|nr:hypothetical protein [Lentisphaeria bacterium]
MSLSKLSSSSTSHNAFYATLSAFSGAKSLAVLAFAFLLTAGSLSAADFFKNDVFSDLPKDKLYPQGVTVITVWQMHRIPTSTLRCQVTDIR